MRLYDHDINLEKEIVYFTHSAQQISSRTLISKRVRVCFGAESLIFPDESQVVLQLCQHCRVAGDMYWNMTTNS